MQLLISSKGRCQPIQRRQCRVVVTGAFYQQRIVEARGLRIPPRQPRKCAISPYNHQNRLICYSQDVVSTEDNNAQAEADSSSDANGSGQAEKGVTQELPSGELVYTKPDRWQRLLTSFKLIFALPWRRFKKGSVLTLQLEGNIQELLPGSFSRALSLPAICESLIKAAYDPRVSGVLLQIGPLENGWATIQEIRRHIEFFQQSGKFSIAYMEIGAEKEYMLASACEELYIPPAAYVNLRGLSVSGTFLRGTLDKIGVEPQVRSIGKYKSAGELLSREDMSEFQKEQLLALLEDLYNGFVAGVAKSRGKSEEEVKTMLDKAYIEKTDFKDAGWVTDLKYMDEIVDMIKERQGLERKKKIKRVTLRRYTKVKPSTFGLGGRKTIAVVRAAGNIVAQGADGSVGSDVIISKKFIREIQQARDNKAVQGIVVRVDSRGGDALASDLMWREIQRAVEEKPVIVSMGNYAASGGYYMSMAGNSIVAEDLTVTGSIGVVLGKFALSELYKKIGINKEFLSRGRFAELLVADNRSFSEEEEKYFSDLAQSSYTMFRDRAAQSRGMSEEDMEELAQGRVWSGRRAIENGLIDGIGGISRAVAIAKQAAKIPQDAPVRILELSRQKASPFEVLQGSGALSGVVGSALLVLLGVFSFVAANERSGKIDGVLTSLLGAFGIVGPQLNKPGQSEIEYLMDEVEVDRGSQFVLPKAQMDDDPLDTGVGKLLNDVISSIW